MSIFKCIACNFQRRRSLSSEESSELSDEDISYLEYPEKSNKGSSFYSTNGGVDEVDSDETAETVTKRMTSSSSSNEQNPRQVATRSSNVKGQRIQVALNTSTSEDNAGNVTAFTDLDNSDVGGVGEEQHVRFSFIQELNEAANESYNSLEDPDYEVMIQITTSHLLFKVCQITAFNVNAHTTLVSDLIYYSREKLRKIFWSHLLQRCGLSYYYVVAKELNVHFYIASELKING